MREQFADVIGVMLSTAPHDAGVAEQLASATAVYRGAIVPIAERLAELGALRPGADTSHAVDVLWFYFGYSSYFTLHDDNRWSYHQAERWLADQARRELLSHPPPRREPGRDRVLRLAVALPGIAGAPQAGTATGCQVVMLGPAAPGGEGAVVLRVDEDGLRRWQTAWARLDSEPVRPIIFAPQFTPSAVGRDKR